MSRRRRQGQQQGFTLVELLIVVLIVGVVGGIATAGVVAAVNSASQSRARVDATQELEFAGQRIIREIRAAQSVFSPSSDPENDLCVEVLQGGSTVWVRFLVEDPGDEDLPVLLLSETYGNLETDEFCDDGDLVTGRTLVTSVDVPDILVSADPEQCPEDLVFCFLDQRGRRIDCSTDSCSSANSIEVQLRRVLESGGDPIVVRSQATIRSFRYG